MAKAVNTRRVIRSRGNSRQGRETKIGPVPASSQSTDYGRIAVAHFGTSAPAVALESLAKTIAAMRNGEGLGGKGSGAIRTLASAGRAAQAAAEDLREVPLPHLIDALRHVAPTTHDTSQRPSLALPHGMAAVAHVRETLMVLDRLGEGLLVAARKQPRLERGRPPISRVLAFAVEALEAVWRHHRSDAPTGSAKTGGFALLAQDVLTAAPCNFAAVSVARATTTHVRARQRAERKTSPVALSAPVPLPGPGNGRWPVSVLVVGAHDPAAQALARRYADAGATVTVTLPSDRAMPAWARTSRITVVPLELTKVPTPSDLAKLGSGPLDLVVIAGLIDPKALTARPGAAAVETADLERWAACMLPLPARLAALMQALRSRLVQRPGAKVVVLTAQEGILALGGTANAAAVTTLAAIHSLVQCWARDLRPHGLTVTAVYPSWGRKADGTPNRYSSPVQTGAALQDTIARLGAEQHGMLTDLHGSRAPW